MAYIYPAPGSSTAGATLKIAIYESGGTYAGDDILTVPALQDVTVNAANDVFTWTQLDQAAKLQIATTATNSLSMNIVLAETSFFGDSGATARSTANKGLFGLSKEKNKIVFDLYVGDTDSGINSKFITGEGYITGLAPTVSADAPVWVSPITITVDTDYTVGTSATLT